MDDFWIAGVCFNRERLNKLFQLDMSLSDEGLWQIDSKPKSWAIAMQANPYAIANLRYRLLQPIPHQFIDYPCQALKDFLIMYAPVHNLTPVGERIEFVALLIRIGKRHPWLSLPVDDLIDMSNLDCISNLEIWKTGNDSTEPRPLSIPDDIPLQPKSRSRIELLKARAL